MHHRAWRRRWRYFRAFLHVMKGYWRVPGYARVVWHCFYMWDLTHRKGDLHHWNEMRKDPST